VIADARTIPSGRIAWKGADAATRAKLASLGQQIPPPEQQTAAAPAAWQKAEIEKWRPLIKEVRIKAE
jgi:hypothetical protein